MSSTVETYLKIVQLLQPLLFGILVRDKLEYLRYCIMCLMRYALVSHILSCKLALSRTARAARQGAILLEILKTKEGL